MSRITVLTLKKYSQIHSIQTLCLMQKRCERARVIV